MGDPVIEIPDLVERKESLLAYSWLSRHLIDETTCTVAEDRLPDEMKRGMDYLCKKGVVVKINGEKDKTFIMLKLLYVVKRLFCEIITNAVVPSSPSLSSSSKLSIAAAAMKEKKQKGSFQFRTLTEGELANLPPEQRGFYHHFLKHDISVLCGIAGTGKCFGAGTKLLMHDGSMKNVEDVKEGELLMGDDSTPRTVKAGSVISGRAMMYEIQSNHAGRDTWRCNGAHILVLKCLTKPWVSFVLQKWLALEWKMVATQTPNSFILSKNIIVQCDDKATALGACLKRETTWQPQAFECTVDDYLTMSAEAQTCCVMYQPDVVTYPMSAHDLHGRLSEAFGYVVSCAQLEAAAFLIGAWCSDGTPPSQNIELQVYDITLHRECVVGHVRAAYNKLYNDQPSASVSTKYEKRDMFSFDSMSVGAILWKVLQSYFVEDNKRLPLPLLSESSVEVRRQLLFGISTRARRNGVICAKEREFMDGVIHLCRGLGICTEKVVYESFQEKGGDTYSGWSLHVPDDIQQYDFDFQCLLDKNCLHTLSNGHKSRTVHHGFSISCVGEGIYHGFTTTGNGRFLLGDFVVTHNTEMSRLIDTLSSHSMKVVAITNKAVKVVKNRVQCECFTIDSFTNKLMRASTNKDINILIMDESSMTDEIRLFRLFSTGIRFHKLVLVGDHNQIPSHGVFRGAMLEEMMKMYPVYTLTTVYRQALINGRSKILENAQQILARNTSHQYFDNKYFRIRQAEKGIAELLGIYVSGHYDNLRIVCGTNKDADTVNSFAVHKYLEYLDRIHKKTKVADDTEEAAASEPMVAASIELTSEDRDGNDSPSNASMEEDPAETETSEEGDRIVDAAESHQQTSDDAKVDGQHVKSEPNLNAADEYDIHLDPDAGDSMLRAIELDNATKHTEGCVYDTSRSPSHTSINHESGIEGEEEGEEVRCEEQHENEVEEQEEGREQPNNMVGEHQATDSDGQHHPCEDDEGNTLEPAQPSNSEIPVVGVTDSGVGDGTSAPVAVACAEIDEEKDIEPPLDLDIPMHVWNSFPKMHLINLFIVSDSLVVTKRIDRQNDDVNDEDLNEEYYTQAGLMQNKDRNLFTNGDEGRIRTIFSYRDTEKHDLMFAMRHTSLRAIIDRIPQRYQRRFRDLLDIPESDIYIEFQDGRIARLNDPFLHSYGSTINKNQGSSANVVALFNPDFKTSEFMRKYFSYRHLYTCVSRPVMEFWYCGNGPDEFNAMIKLDPAPSLSCLSDVFKKHIADGVQNRAQSKLHVPMFTVQAVADKKKEITSTASSGLTVDGDGNGPVRSKFVAGSGTSANDLWLKLQQNKTKVKRVEYVAEHVSTDEDSSDSDNDGDKNSNSDDSDSNGASDDDGGATAKRRTQKKQAKYKRKAHPPTDTDAATSNSHDKGNNKRQKGDTPASSSNKTRQVYNKRINNNGNAPATTGQASITSFFTSKPSVQQLKPAAAVSAALPSTASVAESATSSNVASSAVGSSNENEPTPMDIE